MVGMGVALAWAAISGISLKWLSVLGQPQANDDRELELCPRDGELLPEELYPVEVHPLATGGFR
jgi:hypothetical protein